MTVNASPILGGTVTPLVDGPIVAWPANQGVAYSLTLAGNRALANATDPIPGATYILAITQGSGGSHTLSYGSNYFIPNGSPIALSTTAGAVDILTWWYDGAHMNLVSISLGVSSPILAPSNLTASTDEVDQITLNWVNNATDATSLWVEFFDESTWQVAETLAPDQTSYVYSDPGSGLSVDFRIIANRGAGHSLPSNVATGQTAP